MPAGNEAEERRRRESIRSIAIRLQRDRDRERTQDEEMKKQTNKTRSRCRVAGNKFSFFAQIPMSQYEDDIDTRLQPVVESPPLRLQHQQSTPRKKSSRSGSPRAFSPTRSTSPPRSINQSSISITPPLARSNTPTRPASSRMKYGQTEI